ncbi:MAG: D-glycerate dehydrogenase [bacterium]|nr:D-glycerate dehydrogenase [bacterium]
MTANVFVTRMIPQPALDRLKAAGIQFDVYSEDQVIPRDVLLKEVKGRDGVLCILTETIDAEVFDAADKAKIFANYAVGFNNVDVAEATRRGVCITNTPGVLTDATADLAWTLLMSSARRVAECDGYLRAGKYTGWGPMLWLGQDVSERTLGVIGMGRIGRAFAERAAAFRMKVLYTDAQPNKDFEAAYPYEVRFVEMDELLRKSDFVSVHVPLLDSTHHLISERELKMMQPHAILINSARGPIVDEAALVKALKEGWIWSAGLDVYEEEPAVHPELVTLPNCVLLPHLGSATIETRTRMGYIAVDNLIAFFKGEKPPTLVNPDVWKG